MNRRRFIQNTGMLTAMSLLPAYACQKAPASKYKMGYQLFSIRDQMAKDPLATLKALIAMGYESFETYGYEPDTDQIYGYTAQEFRSVLDDLQVVAPSGHFGFDPFHFAEEAKILRFVDGCLKGAETMGMKYITWPWLAPEKRNPEGFKQLVIQLNRIGKHLQGSGIGLAFHNHGYEFEDHNGVKGYDMILQETDPELVKLQLDMYWLKHSTDMTPQQLADDQPGRYVMWHIKDMDKVTRDYTELGNGSIDYTTYLPKAEDSGLEFYFIEQGGNFTVNSTVSAKASAEYFKANLQQLI